ncbi:MAG: T9SS type A sorting domain-containing protein [candidate division WOR-3 bacterium]
MTAGNYTCRLSFAQPIASNILTSSNYRGIFGFWHPPYEGGVIIKEEDFYKSLSFPLVFSLSQCYPNPFNNKTIICYSLPKETEVSLEVLNTAGRVVTTLVRGTQKPGYYNVTWSVKNVPKTQFPNGVYFYRLKAGEFVAIKKMVKTE